MLKERLDRPSIRSRRSRSTYKHKVHAIETGISSRLMSHFACTQNSDFAFIKSLCILLARVCAVNMWRFQHHLLPDNVNQSNGAFTQYLICWMRHTHVFFALLLTSKNGLSFFSPPPANVICLSWDTMVSWGRIKKGSCSIYKFLAILVIRKKCFRPKNVWTTLKRKPPNGIRSPKLIINFFYRVRLRLQWINERE